MNLRHLDHAILEFSCMSTGVPQHKLKEGCK